jgi:hypothetical protein
MIQNQNFNADSSALQGTTNERGLHEGQPGSYLCQQRFKTLSPVQMPDHSVPIRGSLH